MITQMDSIIISLFFDFTHCSFRYSSSSSLRRVFIQRIDHPITRDKASVGTQGRRK